MGGWGGLAFRGRILAQEGGDGAGLGDFLGERALHVFDGWIGSGVQQELHDVGKLARRCCQKINKRSTKAEFRQAEEWGPREGGGGYIWQTFGFFPPKNRKISR